MNKFYKTGLLLTAPLLALPAFAQTSFSSILGTIAALINTIIPILIAVALAFFIYGVIKFIMAKDGDGKGEARKIVINGIIGLFVIISVWGLVGVIQSTFGIGAGGSVGTGSGTVPMVELF